MTDTSRIYKICTEQEWRIAQEAGVYSGSGDDIRDGFIHFSSESQINGTLEKHFAGKKELLLLTVSTDKLNRALLKWEISRNNEKFPHLYGALNLDAVIDIKPLPDN